MYAANARRGAFVLLALLAGAALRFYFLHAYPQVEGDSLIYGDIAKNWLLHGVYGLSSAGGIRPTLIRLPGYPLFLAACFRFFGVEHYGAVAFLQIAIDLISALLIAAFAGRIWNRRAAWIALYLACLCPFTASYTAAPLTETLSIFCVALALYSLALLRQQPGWRALALLTLAFSYAALLRPDGALVAVALWPAILAHGASPAGGRRWPDMRSLGISRALRYALLSGAIAVLPFVPWAIRNHQTFHVFEPLAPRYATDPGEFTAPGFQRWVKTWCIDFSSTYEIYWNANSDPFDITRLPRRAFDSSTQYEETRSLFDDYNQDTTLTPEIDARFAELAEARVRAHPLRYYVELPLARLANMWLRPRVENLWIELRWWEFGKHHSETLFAWSYAALNLALLAAAAVGLLRRPPLAGAMLAYVLLRSLLLATIEAPETRYTLECFPIVLALAAVAFAGKAPEACAETGRTTRF